MAVNTLGDALSGAGGSFANDDDPELVRAAVPFSLKLIESLLAENPKHRGLLLAAAKGFTQFGVGFVGQEADFMEEADLEGAERKRRRARNLFLRARDYGLRGLELSGATFREPPQRNPKEAVARAKPKDVPFLYWTAAAWGSAIALSKDDPDLIADQVIVEALIDRALVLDEGFDHGAIHAFLISYEMSRQGGEGAPEDRARRHFERAVELSHGLSAGPYVVYAESAAVQTQNVALFRSLLKKALAIDAGRLPEFRLANLLAQERARWLLSREDELFLTPHKPEP
jgi:predicted anti-sigma-YlaC factor YlaD